MSNYKFSKTIEGLSDQPFWDVQFEKLDPKKNQDFIISRVFDRGKWDDILSILIYYGRNKVLKSLLNADYLMEHSINLAIGLFHVKPSQFKCYTQTQLHPAS
ncbi:MAG: hypothetical protein HY738_16805 [Bacteroidia bacterium]|nr:hypothetical protein [Bacteroidia bacterium]